MDFKSSWSGHAAQSAASAPAISTRCLTGEHRAAPVADGKKRPDFAVNPKAGEESVWDYPRPQESRMMVEVIVRSPEEELVAKSFSAKRLCETASPPQFYLPLSDVVCHY